MLLHAPNQRYKQLKIKNGQNDHSDNFSVKNGIVHCIVGQSHQSTVRGNLDDIRDKPRVAEHLRLPLN